jgi:ribonuclease BN (tRNA processing enzyme)
MKIDAWLRERLFLHAKYPALRVIDADNKQWLIDCGPTVPRALWQRGGEVNDIDAIYFTHVHPDHCTGLTALLNYWKSSPVRSRHYLLPAGAAAGAHAAGRAGELAAGGPGFTIDWQECREAWTWQDWQIRTAPTQHELSNRAIRITIAGQTLFYSGDGRPTADSIALMAGAGLAFQECASVAALDDDASHGDFLLPDAVQNAAAPGDGALSLRGCFSVGAKAGLSAVAGLIRFPGWTHLNAAASHAH